MTRIGYMGIPFSFTEGMTQSMAAELGIDAEKVPLETARGVVGALREGKIDLGVLAVRNSTFGPVIETEKALEGFPHKVLMRRTMPVRQCIFVRSPGAKVSIVASHVQALGQCRGTLDRLYPGAARKEISDTAVAAEMVSDGRLPADCAVVCRKEAGLHYGLHLVMENAEDREDNATEFILISAE